MKTDDKSTMKINRQMTIDDILSLYPNKAQKIAQEMTKAGLHCAGCHAATWETLEAGMLGHGMNEQAITYLEDKINGILQEESDPFTITLTPIAAEKFNAILQEEGKKGWGLRLDEEMAGCSGFEYILDYCEKALPEDETFVSQSIQIHVNKKKVSRLIGTEIDFVESLQNSGFKISNPNVRSSCGCGTSHGY